jgi:hypothetical protein
MARKQWITHIYQDGKERGHAYGPYRTRKEAVATAHYWVQYYGHHIFDGRMVEHDTRWVFPSFGRTIEVKVDAA